jgi:hypothetical protein
MRYNRGAFNYRTYLNLEQFTIAEKQHFLLNVFVESLNKGCSTMMGQKGGWSGRAPVKVIWRLIKAILLN